MDRQLKDLSDSDNQVLKYTWDYFKSSGEWPSEKLFRKRLKDLLGKDVLDSSINNLADLYLIKADNGSQSRQFQLSFEGLYAAEGELSDFMKITCIYLDYVKEVYNKDPNIGTIRSSDLEHLLSRDKLSKLMVYIYMGHLWGRSISGLSHSWKNPNEVWEVGVLDSIEELDEAESSKSFLERKMLKNIELAIRKKTQWQSPGSYDYSIRPNVLGISDFVSQNRIFQIANLKGSFDFRKLCRLLEELNSNFNVGNHYSCAFILRAIIDHVPPAFGYLTFTEVVNNHSTKSFKESILRLNESLRKITDSFLHTKIRKSETLPEQQQIRFEAELDSLLAELVRTCSSTNLN